MAAAGEQAGGGGVQARCRTRTEREGRREIGAGRMEEERRNDGGRGTRGKGGHVREGGEGRRGGNLGKKGREGEKRR